MTGRTRIPLARCDARVRKGPAATLVGGSVIKQHGIQLAAGASPLKDTTSGLGWNCVQLLARDQFHLPAGAVPAIPAELVDPVRPIWARTRYPEEAYDTSWLSFRPEEQMRLVEAEPIYSSANISQLVRCGVQNSRLRPQSFWLSMLAW